MVYEDIFDAKNACDHLSGFNVCNRYLVVLYYQPNKVRINFLGLNIPLWLTLFGVLDRDFRLNSIAINLHTESFQQFCSLIEKSENKSGIFWLKNLLSYHAKQLYVFVHSNSRKQMWKRRGMSWMMWSRNMVSVLQTTQKNECNHNMILSVW